jgi:hypothetical protein
VAEKKHSPAQVPHLFARPDTCWQKKRSPAQISAAKKNYLKKMGVPGIKLKIATLNTSKGSQLDTKNKCDKFTPKAI